MGVTALVDGLAVGGWYASAELDGDRPRRRRVRLALTATDDWVRGRQGREPLRTARH